MVKPNDVLAPVVTLYDYGYGKGLVKNDPFYDDLSVTQSSVSDGINPANIQSGSTVSNLIIADGNVRSANFVSGVSGWRLTDSTAEFVSVTAQGGTIGGWTIAATSLSSSNITLDSSTPRILIGDGTNNRILIGKQTGGF